MKDIVSWVHFGDLHIADWQDQNYTDFVNLIIEANRHLTFGIDFALLPGDNADNGEEDEYEVVRRALDRCRLRVYAITGDHDCASGSLDLFQQYLSPLPYHSVSKGNYHFAFLNSVATWEPPRFGLGSKRIAWLQEDLAAAADDGLPSVLFMHGYPSEHGSDAAALCDLIRRHRVLVVDMGHTHYNELANDGHTIYATTRSTGQVEEGPVGFSIATLDHSVVSWKFKPIAEWPLVMITSPSDHRLIVDPASSDQIVRGLISVRARAWGDDFTSLTLRVNDAFVGDMLPSGEALWSAEWDSTRHSDGLHSLLVQARDRTGRREEDRIDVLVNQAGVYCPVPRKSIDRENALGAWPEKHILGTQLGPDRNGRKWPSTRKAQVT